MIHVHDRQVMLAGVEDVSALNRHLRGIHRGLMNVKRVLSDATLSTNNMNSIIRVQLIDMQHAAPKIIQQEGITDEILEKYGINNIMSLEHLIYEPGAYVPTNETLNTFLETMFEDMWEIYTKTFVYRLEKSTVSTEDAKETELTENEKV